MLQIGQRTYALVRAQSGFHVTLDPSETADFYQQKWLFDAHYIPGDADPGAPPNAAWEYQQVMNNPLWLKLADWRDLIAYHPTDHGPGGFYPYAFSLENLLAERQGGPSGNVRTVYPGEFSILRREGYLFHCEFAGEIDPEGEERNDDTEREELTLRDAIPFASVTVRVPINSSDPVAAARALAARELHLTETRRACLRPYDPKTKFHSRTLGTDRHSVLLETPWRQNQG